MSYILDALKNSDRARDRGKIPDLQSQPFIIAEVHGRRSTPIIWAALSVMVIALAYIGLTSLTHPTDERGPTEVDTAPLEIKTTQAKTLSIQDISADKLKIQLPVELNDPPLRTDDWLLPAESLSDAKGIRIQLDKSDADETQADRRVRLSAGTPSVKSPVKQTALAVATKKTPIFVSPAPAVTSEKTIDPYAGIPHMRQLEARIQRQLPEMAFTVHIYSSSPESRLVKINGQRRKEGERIANSLKLVEITREGVILQFKSHRFWRGTR